MYKGKRKQWK